MNNTRRYKIDTWLQRPSIPSDFNSIILKKHRMSKWQSCTIDKQIVIDARSEISTGHRKRDIYRWMYILGCSDINTQMRENLENVALVKG